MSDAMQKVIEAADELSSVRGQLEYQVQERGNFEVRLKAAQEKEARLQAGVKEAEERLKSASAELAAEPVASAEPRFRCKGCRAPVTDREAGVFSLHYFGEMANGHIAETLAISADAVGVALHKARKRLKELLDLEEVCRRRSRS